MAATVGVGTVGIVGAGFMGVGIAEVTAKAGYPTVLVKATPGSLDSARKTIEGSFSKAVAKGKLSPEDRDAALARLEWATDLGALGAADLVIESIIEDLDIKRQLFAQLDRLAPPHAIFASNTSTLRIAAIAAAVPDRAERTIGLHFFSPVPLMELVELSHLPETRADVMEAAAGFVRALGKTPVTVRDSTGFIVNRLLVPYLIGAIQAYEQGLARPEEIDLAMRLGCGHPMGPLALADLIGLDVVYAMANLLHADFADPRYRAPALLRQLVETGALGKKAKLGFYDYRSGPIHANEELWLLVRSGTFWQAETHAHQAPR